MAWIFDLEGKKPVVRRWLTRGYCAAEAKAKADAEVFVWASADHALEGWGITSSCSHLPPCLAQPCPLQAKLPTPSQSLSPWVRVLGSLQLLPSSPAELGLQSSTQGLACQTAGFEPSRVSVSLLV